MAYSDPVKRAACNEKYRRRYHSRKRWIDKIKQAAGCEECGYNAHPAALDFDHRDPNDKLFLIPRILQRSPLKVIFNEIRKCRILCANCHRVHSRHQWDSGLTYRTKADV